MGVGSLNRKQIKTARVTPESDWADKTEGTAEQ